MVVGNIEIPEDKIAQFCRQWKVKECALFGSVLRKDFSSSSDVDVLVTFAPDAHWTLFDHFRMENELVDLFGREVDLVTRRAVEENSNWIRPKKY